MTAAQCAPILFAAVVSAGTAVQTNWSGGPGTPGPVTEWQDVFGSSSGIGFDEIPGTLRLVRGLDPQEHTVAEGYDSPVCVRSADMDGDGDADLVSAASQDDLISWWENVDGTGTSWSEHTIDGSAWGACWVVPGDIDGDGDFDVVCSVYYEDTIDFWENVDGAGGSWQRHEVASGPDGVNRLSVCDIDGDGDLDVAAAARSDHEVLWFENLDGAGSSWGQRTIENYFPWVFSVHAVDIEGDGDGDVLATRSNTDSLMLYRNSDGSGYSWDPEMLDIDVWMQSAIDAGDVDGDGDVDIGLSRRYGYDCFSWVEQDDGEWYLHDECDIYSPADVQLVDLDSDGDLDAICAMILDGSGGVAWAENLDGTGGSWESQVIADLYSGSSCCAADLDGNGILDVAAADDYDDLIRWWSLWTHVAGGSLESSILDTQEQPQWDGIDWSSVEPAGTSVAFQVRASGDPANMGSWSDTLDSPCSLQGVIEDLDRYVQYRAILGTSDELITPSLEDVSIGWTPLGIESGNGQCALHGVMPNPSAESSAIVFSLVESAPVSLRVYDLSGRLVMSVDGSFPAGRRQVKVPDLLPGVYIVRMESGGYTASHRFAVVD